MIYMLLSGCTFENILVLYYSIYDFYLLYLYFKFHLKDNIYIDYKILVLKNKYNRAIHTFQLKNLKLLTLLIKSPCQMKEMYEILFRPVDILGVLKYTETFNSFAKI